MFFTIIFQGGILFHYLVKDRMVSVLKISEYIRIIALYRQKICLSDMYHLFCY
ncbi:hypothetical protein EC100869_4500 [Escherichia coli 10.0869]|nr:hypothetical protein EC100869_4500 [Escherichia coli 10.0869]